MAEKTCSDCGKSIKGMVFGTRCLDCQRVPYARARAYFERNTLAEQEIQKWKPSPVILSDLAYAAFLYACILLGALVGYGSGGTIRGLYYSFVGVLLGIITSRLWVSRKGVNPLKTWRWYNFAFPFTFLLYFPWAFAYVAWMPNYGGFPIAYGPILSHHVMITPTLHLPAFTLAFLVGLLGALIGIAVGAWNAARQTASNREHLLSLYQRWLVVH